MCCHMAFSWSEVRASGSRAQAHHDNNLFHRWYWKNYLLRKSTLRDHYIKKSSHSWFDLHKISSLVRISAHIWFTYFIWFNHYKFNSIFRLYLITFAFIFIRYPVLVWNYDYPTEAAKEFSLIAKRRRLLITDIYKQIRVSCVRDFLWQVFLYRI